MPYLKNLLHYYSQHHPSQSDSSQSYSKRSNRLNALIGGLLVALPAIPTVLAAAALAQTPGINPCPQIYYEEPFNTDRRVPEGCPPNAATLEETGQQGTGQPPAAPAPLPAQVTPTVPGQVPPPENVQPPSAFVTPTNNTLSIELVNNTGTEVTYEVIGQTDQRSIAGRSEVTLRDLQLPLNMTFVRPDGGFVTVTPQESAPGVLTVTLAEAPNVDAGRGALNVRPDGNVFLN